jgi:hypothetical protein
VNSPRDERLEAEIEQISFQQILRADEQMRDFFAIAKLSLPHCP